MKSLSGLRARLVGNTGVGLQPRLELVQEALGRAEIAALRAGAPKRHIRDYGEIGVLSIDIDGNDYWVWQALDVVTPAIVVIEFNGRFGFERAVTIPYHPNFNRMEASHSGIYYGASLAAMVHLGAEKGYDYVGSNGADTNAFFVRSNLRPATLPRLPAAEGYRRLRAREMRDEQGQLVFAGPDEEEAVLRTLPVVDVAETLAGTSNAESPL